MVFYIKLNSLILMECLRTLLSFTKKVSDSGINDRRRIRRVWWDSGWSLLRAG